MDKAVIVLILAAAVLFVGASALWSTPAQARPTGVVGYSGNPGFQGAANCSECHTGQTTDPIVTISTATQVSAGQTSTVTVTISGGPGVVGGFNASFDDFQGVPAAVNGETQQITQQMTHTTPKAFVDGELSFEFEWTAPEDTPFITLYAAGLSANGNGSLVGDAVGTARLRIDISEPATATPTPTPTPTATATPVPDATATPALTGAGAAPLNYDGPYANAAAENSSLFAVPAGAVAPAAGVTTESVHSSEPGLAATGVTVELQTALAFATLATGGILVTKSRRSRGGL